jgi:acyl-CoA dehydrogenase
MKSGLFSEILSECDRFARKEIDTCALEADLSGDKNTARRLWETSRELDLPLLLIPETYGGAGMALMSGGLVLDRLAGACAGFASVLAFHFAACAAASACGSTGSGKWFSFLTGSDCDKTKLSSVCLPPKLEENGLSFYLHNNIPVVSGQSMFVGNAGLASSIMVFAFKNGNPDDPAALRIAPATTGVEWEPPLLLPGLKLNSFARLRFENVPVEADAVLAEGQEAKKLIRAAEHAVYGLIAAVAMGCARKAHKKAKDYAGQRYQFKQTIIYHQEIQRLLGKMAMNLNVGTAGFLDLLDGEKRRPSFHVPQASLVKAFCTDAALGIVADAIQIHGGYGYMHEYGLEKSMRDAKVLQVLGETNPYLLVRHTADSL